MFKRFKAGVEKEIGMCITCLRTDRGGEFTSMEFEEFCRTQGISRQLTTAYTPQQNGVAERKNKTIMNAVRAILNEKQVPKVFWPEAARWCVHVQNRSPTSAVEQKTPEEAWCGEKPRVDYFRVFGCVAHAHIPDQKRSKLDDKSKRCVFLGVSDESKAYKLFDPLAKKVIISRDVIFEEDKSWDWEGSKEESNTDVLDWDEQTFEAGREDSRSAQQEGNDSITIGVSSSYPNDNSNETSPSLAENADEHATQVQGRAMRQRRKPVWMADYTHFSAEVDLIPTRKLLKV